MAARKTATWRWCKFLVERGADQTFKDDLYQSDAEGAAAYFGQVAVQDYLRSIRKPAQE